MPKTLRCRIWPKTTTTTTKKPEQNTPPYTKSKVKAEVENPTKVNYDSGAGHQAQPLSIIKTSAVDVMEEGKDAEEKRSE